MRSWPPSRASALCPDAINGEIDWTGRITKQGDGTVRKLLYEAANSILTRSRETFALKTWAMKIAKRRGLKKARVALARRLGELDGFLGGLFNEKDAIDLPERAHEAVGHFAELRAMMAGICDLVARDPDADDRTQLDITFKHLRELTRIMETEIHEAVLSCTRARRQMLEGILTLRPTVH